MFSINEKESLSIKKWVDSHFLTCVKYINNSKKEKSKFKIILTPGEIGTSVKVKCNYCKQKLDVTDYGSW